VQIENSNIILTGSSALNKVLGRQVYSSNNQLGGTRIMHYNGVSHLTASDDFAGVQTVVNWLSYIPAVWLQINGYNKSQFICYLSQAKNAPLPILPTADAVDRKIEFMPTKVPYDPRWIIEGRPNPGRALHY
jgi:acetyl-CoA carboxylase carboxyltransferase component